MQIEADLWQPIETGPKDGTRVLLYLPDLTHKIQVGYFRDRVELAYGVEVSRLADWFSEAAFMEMARIRRWAPTHWMPLPKSPADLRVGDPIVELKKNRDPEISSHA